MPAPGPFIADDLFRRSVLSTVVDHERFATPDAAVARRRCSAASGRRPSASSATGRPAAADPPGRRRPPHDRRRHPAQPGARAARRRGDDGAAGSAVHRPAPRPGRQQPRPRPRSRRAGQRLPVAGGARGLELHFDQHDVFVLQLAGRKRWRVWEPLERTRLPVRIGPPVPMPTFDELGRRRSTARWKPATACTCRGVPARRRDRRRVVGAPHDRRDPADVAPGRAPRRRRGRRRGRAARVDPRRRPRGPDLALVADSLDAPAVRRWMATEVWRKQPATRLRPLQPPRSSWTRGRGDAGPAAVAHRLRGAGRARSRRPHADDAGEAYALLGRVLRSTGRFELGRLDVGLDEVPSRRRPAPRRRRGDRPWVSPGYECARASVRATSRCRRRPRRCRRGCSSRSTDRGARRRPAQRTAPHAPAVWREAMRRRGIRVIAIRRNLTHHHDASSHAARLVHVVAPRPGAVTGSGHPARSVTCTTSCRRQRRSLPDTATTAGGNPTASATSSSAQRPPGSVLATYGRPIVRGLRATKWADKVWSAHTSAAIGSPATSCCCPTACTSAARPRRHRARARCPRQGAAELNDFRGRATFRLHEQAAEHSCGAGSASTRSTPCAGSNGWTTNASVSRSTSTAAASAYDVVVERTAVPARAR